MAITCKGARFDRCPCSNTEPHGRIWFSNGDVSKNFGTKKEGMIYISRAALRGHIKMDDAPRLMNALLASDLPDGAIARMCNRGKRHFDVQHAMLCIPNEPWLAFTSKTGGRMLAEHAMRLGHFGVGDMIVILQEIDRLPLPYQDEDYDRTLGCALDIIWELPSMFDEQEVSFELFSDAPGKVEVRRMSNGGWIH